jgi:hypothetical protein
MSSDTLQKLSAEGWHLKPEVSTPQRVLLYFTMGASRALLEVLHSCCCSLLLLLLTAAAAVRLNMLACLQPLKALIADLEDEEEEFGARPAVVSYTQLKALLLDADLRKLSSGGLPEDVNRVNSGSVTGPLVLQVPT